MRKPRKAPIEAKNEGQQFKPQNREQVDYVRAISECTVTICKGISGSGKSMVAVGLACEYLRQGKVERILVSRPIVAAGENFGSLPGSVREKTDPYFRPVIEYFKHFLGMTLYNKFFFERKIVFEPVELLRGMTFDNTLMLLDEAQNCTVQQYKLFLSRFGKDSKVIINGDTDQCDIPNSGLSYIFGKLSGMENVATVTLNQVLRNDLIGKILQRI